MVMLTASYKLATFFTLNFHGSVEDMEVATRESKIGWAGHVASSGIRGKEKNHSASKAMACVREGDSGSRLGKNSSGFIDLE